MSSSTVQCVTNLITAHAAGAPYVSVSTPDPINLMKEVEVAAGQEWPDIAIFSFDVFNGLDFINNAAKNYKSIIEGKATGAKPIMLVPVMLRLCEFMPDGSIIFFLNYHKSMDKADVLSGFQQMRSKLETKQVTMICLAPTNSLPAELRPDFLMYREKLPRPSQLRAMADDVISSIERDSSTDLNITDDQRIRIVNTLNGLSMFNARNVLSMAVLSGDGVDFSVLNERKEEMIHGIQGLRIHKDNKTFNEIGGHANAKRIFNNVLTKGKGRVRLVVVWEEIEKMFGGVMGANDSGVSKRLMGRLLTFMVQKKVVSFLLSGVTGAGKSAVAEAACNEAGVPLLFAEMGSVMSSLVGSSEANLDAMLDTFEALSAGDNGVEEGAIIFIATSNEPDTLPAELLRRFEHFKIFFEEPNSEERKSIWSIFLNSYGIEGTEVIPNDEGWTGDEIRRCCFNSSFMGIPLTEAAKDIIPVTVSHAAKITEMKLKADKRYVSSSYAGVYEYQKQEENPAPRTGRKISPRTLAEHPNAPE